MSFYSDYSISSDQRCLVHLGNRIQHLEHVLTDLEEQRNALIYEHSKVKANILAKRIAIAPFRSLLPEICDIIFAYCCHPVCNLTCDQDNISESGPLILSAVCRRWRAIVLNNPTLWTTLHHHLLVPTASNKLKLWLERSASLALVFTACPVVAQVYEAATDVMPLIHRMAPHFHRIKYFKSYLAAGFLPLFFSIPMPALEELVLFVNEMSYRNPPFDASVPLGLLEAPNLRVLHVYDLTLMQTAIAPVLPCLKSLVIDANTSWTTPWLRPQTFPSLLAQCIFLQSCTINFHPDSDFTFHALDPITLPQLETLNVCWPKTFDPSSFFCHIATS
ncbi:hypothetical protein BJ165DRAFT_803215 [Panaeolus papilionaceus]|nr:hypothetical protein BJ165DRAFT_803215 [Panaeolus papilionaceus]